MFGYASGELSGPSDRDAAAESLPYGSPGPPRQVLRGTAYPLNGRGASNSTACARAVRKFPVEISLSPARDRRGVRWS